MNKTPVKFTETEAMFLPLVSHDIKSLTRAIYGATQALSSKLNQAGCRDEQMLRDFVRVIHAAGSNLLPLVEDLAAIGKAEANASVIAPRAVYNLRQELECSRDTFSYEAMAKEIELSLLVEDDVPVVYCDISSLRIHAINSILSNAIRHTSVGGKVVMRVAKLDNLLQIKISDTGVGIPLSERERVFRKYLSSEHYRHTTGTKRGIGLHNAQRCVEAHQGSLRVIEDTAFSGATFEIQMPLFATCVQ